VTTVSVAEVLRWLFALQSEQSIAVSVLCTRLFDYLESRGVFMRNGAVTNLLLLVIAVALVAIAARRYIDPAAAEAQSTSAHAFYIEPGVQMLRYPDGTGQVYGKVVVDLRTGKIWGFPTNTPDPYPSYPMDSKPAVSKPFALGKFAFEDTDK